MPSHRWFSQPPPIDLPVGVATIGGNLLTGAVPSDLRSVHTDSAPVHTDLTPVHSDLAPVHTALVAVHTDSAPVHTDIAPISLITLFGPKNNQLLCAAAFDERRDSFAKWMRVM